MPFQEYRLLFVGYWREPNKSGVPAESGIFCTYTCVFDEEQKRVTLHKLVYIDSSDNARESIATHPKWDEWRTLLLPGEQLCFNFAPLGALDLERVTTALVQQNVPAIKRKSGTDVVMRDITVSVEGAASLLKPSFTVS